MKYNILNFALVISNLVNGIVNIDQHRKLDHVSQEVPSRSQTTASCTSSSSLNPSLHGSGILTGTVNLYHIYIGYSDSDYKLPYTSNKQTSTAGILEAFASSLSSSTYASILAAYNVATDIVFKNHSFYNIPSNVKSFNDTSLEMYVSNAIQSAHWSTTDLNALYSVVFRGDISYVSKKNGDAAWNSYWCGFHTQLSHSSPLGRPMSIIGDEAFVTNSALKKGCMSQFIDASTVQYVSTYAPIPIFISPNGNPTADAIVNVYSHEIIETATDVNSNGWFRDCDGNEVADLCAYKFDRIYRSSDGSHYNVQMGSNKYLLQTVWVNKASGTSGCVLRNSSTPILSYPSYAAKDTSTMLYVYIAIGAGGGLLVFSILMSSYYYFCVSPHIKTNKGEKGKKSLKKKKILTSNMSNGDLYPDVENVNGENPLLFRERDGHTLPASQPVLNITPGATVFSGLPEGQMVFAVDDSTGQMYALDAYGRMLRITSPSHVNQLSV